MKIRTTGKSLKIRTRGRNLGHIESEVPKTILQFFRKEKERREEETKDKALLGTEDVLDLEIIIDNSGH